MWWEKQGKLGSEWEGKKSIHAQRGGKRVVAQWRVLGTMDYGHLLRLVSYCTGLRSSMARLPARYSSDKNEMHNAEFEFSAGGTLLEVQLQTFHPRVSWRGQRQHSRGHNRCEHVRV
jgi:hypothetical protein